MFWLGFGDWKNVVWERGAGFADNGERRAQTETFTKRFLLKTKHRNAQIWGKTNKPAPFKMLEEPRDFLVFGFSKLFVPHP